MKKKPIDFLELALPLQYPVICDQTPFDWHTEVRLPTGVPTLSHWYNRTVPTARRLDRELGIVLVTASGSPHSTVTE